MRILTGSKNNDRERTYQKNTNRQEVDRNALAGATAGDALKIYKEYAFNVLSRNQLLLKLKSDLVWISWRKRYAKPLFLPHDLKIKSSLSEAACFPARRTVEDVEKYIGPKAKILLSAHASQTQFRDKNNLAVFSGMGSYFFHNLTDFFGMEECFIKMYTHPDVGGARRAEDCGYLLQRE